MDWLGARQGRHTAAFRRGVALLLALLFVGHYLAMVVDVSAAAPPVPGASVATGVALTKAPPSAAGAPAHHGHHGTPDAARQSSQEQTPDAARPPHCSVVAASLAPPAVPDKAHLACTLASAPEVPGDDTPGLGRVTRGGASPPARNTLRQALLQVFLQ